jgi:CBS domain containing-hemolysin-like protein
MWLGIAAILALVAITGFFVASEFALVSVRKTRVEQLVSEGRRGAKQAKYAIEHLQEYIAAAQVGITMASLGLGALGEPVVAEALRPLLEAILPHDIVEQFISLHGIAIVIAFIVVTILEIVLGETVPKIVAIQHPDRTMLLIVVPLNVFVFLFKPLTWLINTSSNAVLRLFRLESRDEHANVYSVEELEMLVVSSRQAGVLEKEEEAILRRVFDLSDLTARQVMVPRTEIIGVPIDASLPEVIETIEREKHSRFPVYQDDLDDIVGTLHVKDVFLEMAHNLADQSHPADEGFSVRSLVREILKVPQSLSVNELLTQMRVSRVHIAVVIDEYGGTAGMVTLEDILEEIVGEVRDEFEVGEEHPDFVTTPEGILVHGMTSIDDVNEQLGLQIQTEADTIGGYVFDLLGRKPELGDEVSDGRHSFRVEALDGLRIAEVRILTSGKVRAPAPVGEGDE